MNKLRIVCVVLILLITLVTGCAGANEVTTLRIAGIPDQNASTLARRYEVLENYLSAKLGVNVEYVPTVDYSATVTAFRQGDVQMAWFGGLTGVQAREAVPDSRAIAHRPRDAEFHSKFIVSSDQNVSSLADLKGLTFTFGSESSTSGHLMPRHFLLESGVNPGTDFNGPANYSGSHDTTWKLVESGSFQAGVLNEAVWDAAVENGNVDNSKVKEVIVTPPYFDYNWTVRGDFDDQFGEGFTLKVQTALLELNAQEHIDVLELFSTDKFEETENRNYDAIKRVAQELGILRN